MADAAADAPAVPVTHLAGLPPVVLAVWQAALPFGLRHGKHDVAVRATAAAWYPASCGRSVADAGRPCRDAPADSGRLPLLLLVVEREAPSAADTATAQYLASHGYVVVIGTGGAGALSQARRLPFVDSTRVATAEAHPADALVRLSVGFRRVTVASPPGDRGRDRTRLRAVVMHAILDAALRVSPPVLIERARRLGAAGLAVRLGP